MNPQLQHHQALSSQQSLFGLPLPIFALALVISLFGAGLFISGLGIVWGGVFAAVMTALIFKPLQAIHQDDLLAWRLWIRALKTPHFTAHLVQKKVVYIQTQRHIIHFKKWRFPT